ncbi:type I-E CRISPR-associated protein Cas5/CasD [Dietzia sp. 179-F 9C3 NHS]|uniref:type I-E CRISPR-associated protein Cas5/CasD n=1 Tax=Dietzia sp. 179-F 9C3 NHS TaxID=3374295 RepID=UPI003879586F
MTDHTVTFTLAGPMQAWSSAARAAARPTAEAPTKSGVLGLVANALGRTRGDDITDLAALRFAVRIDRPGTHEIDYHTAGSGPFPLLPGEVLRDPTLARTVSRLGWQAATRNYAPPRNIEAKGGTLVAKRPEHGVITRSHYLADAAFTVALTGDQDTVATVADALDRPARPLFLGRKAFPPAAPLDPRRHDIGDQLDALAAHPAHRPAEGDTTVYLEDPAGEIVADQPVDYASRRRTGRGQRRHLIPSPTAAGPQTATPADVDFFTAPATATTFTEFAARPANDPDFFTPPQD